MGCPRLPRDRQLLLGRASLAVAPLAIGSLHESATLTASLVAYAVSTLVCWGMSVGATERFDFSVIKHRTGDFDESEESADVPVAVGSDDRGDDLDPTTAGSTR